MDIYLTGYRISFNGNVSLSLIIIFTEFKHRRPHIPRDFVIQQPRIKETCNYITSINLPASLNGFTQSLTFLAKD